MSDDPNTDVVVEPEVLIEEPAPLEDAETLAALKALSLRAHLGKTEKLPLEYNGVKVRDERFFIQFNDATSEVEDAVQNALNQVEQVGEMEFDEATGGVSREMRMVQHRRFWPVLDVLLDYKVIADAALPQVKSGVANPQSLDDYVAYKWRGSKKLDGDAIRRGGIQTLLTVVQMGMDHVLGTEEGRVVEALGE